MPDFKAQKLLLNKYDGHYWITKWTINQFTTFIKSCWILLFDKGVVMILFIIVILFVYGYFY